ncbi:MAG: alpha/beta hydrolase family protein, partial [Verrucomicrobiales bacterium]
AGLVLWMVPAFVFAGAIEVDPVLPATMPWDLVALSEAPAMRWIVEEGAIRELIYESEPIAGEATEVFAFYASPATIGGDDGVDGGPFPAVVLVHGGGGTAFSEWVWLWAQRGYAAIAMDLSGRRPPAPKMDAETGALVEDLGRNRKDRVRLERGGPEQGHGEKFESIGGSVEDDWPYHAVASVIRAHSLIRSFPEVDAERTALTGISWGGYTACIVASVDNRFAAAVPVYGCGFLRDGDSVQREPIDKLGEERASEWVATYDPGSYLAACRVPMLFVNGTHDIHYPLDSYAKSYRLVEKTERSVRIELKMRHSHPAGWAPTEIGLFIDSHCRGGVPLATVAAPVFEKGGRVRVSFEAEVPVVSAALLYTADEGPRSKREWVSVPAAVGEGEIVAAGLPADANTWFVTLEDERGAMVSSEVGFRE